MGEHSYSETFALWIGNIQATKVRGSDHRGVFRIDLRQSKVKLQYTMGEVDMSASLHARLEESTQQRSQSIGLA